MSIILRGTLITTIILIILIGIFVATEFSIVRVRSTQLEALLLTDHRASIALKVHKNLKRHLSGIQVAITLLTLSIGNVSERAFADFFQHQFEIWISPKAAIIIGTGFGLLILTILQVVLAELLPRSIAIRSTLQTALIMSGPLIIWSKIISPIIYSLIYMTQLIERLGGIKHKNNDSHDESLPSEEELRFILTKGQADGEQEPKRSDLIENVFDFFKRSTKEIAIPRNQVVYLDLHRTLEENLSVAHSCPHTRLPVVDGNLDHVIGIIHLKELLWAIHDHGHNLNLRDLTKPTFSVPEMRLVHDLLLDFQQRKQHLAMVVNEHGGIDGIVTLEDVLEELVGEIQDEFDRDIKNFKRTHSGLWVSRGPVTLEQLEDILGIHLEVTTDSITLGGFFQERLGRVLHVGDEICVPGWNIRVLKMHGMAPWKFLFKPIEINDFNKTL